MVNEDVILGLWFALRVQKCVLGVEGLCMVFRDVLFAGLLIVVCGFLDRVEFAFELNVRRMLEGTP